jgi:hypothetical protein
MRDWLRRHPIGFQACFLGVMFPVVMGELGRWTGFPAPFTPKFLAVWLVLGIFTGTLYYGILRLIHARVSSSK